MKTRRCTNFAQLAPAPAAGMRCVLGLAAAAAGTILIKHCSCKAAGIRPRSSSPRRPKAAVPADRRRAEPPPRRRPARRPAAAPAALPAARRPASQIRRRAARRQARRSYCRLAGTVQQDDGGVARARRIRLRPDQADRRGRAPTQEPQSKNSGASAGSRSPAGYRSALTRELSAMKGGPL